MRLITGDIVKKFWLTSVAVGLATTSAYAADPVLVVPVPDIEVVEVEEAAGPTFTISQLFGRDDDVWFSRTDAEVEFSLSDALGIAINGYGAVAFDDPAEGEVGIGAKLFGEFGNATVGVFTGLAWELPDGDRFFHLGAEVEFEFEPVEIGIEVARIWENGAPEAFELEIEAGVAVGERVTLLAGVGFEWEGGPPPEITIGAGLEVALTDHFALQAAVERVIDDSWSFGVGFILTFGGGDDD